MIRLSLLASFVALTSCTSSSQDSVAVTPQPADVLTCSTVPFSATVAGTPNPAVTWAVDSGAGTIDASGVYTAPIAAPAADEVTISATSAAAKASGEATFTLGTAFPGPATPVAGSVGVMSGTIGIYQHAIAAHASRVYAAWANSPAESANVSMMIARSDDAGATFAAGVSAVATTLADPTGQLNCVAIAVDPGNPDTVYATAQITSDNGLGHSVPSQYADPTLVFAVSHDGGATFTTHVLSDGVGSFDCADIAAPAPNTVVVEAPSGGCGANDADIYVFSDASGGAGFASGTGSATVPYQATEETGALQLVNPGACGNDVVVASNTSNAASGQAIESPRLFTDNAGRLCITYVGQTPEPSPTDEHIYVQCSDNAGASFSVPQVVDAGLASHAHNQPVGAFGPGGAAAIAWTIDATELYVATSTDGGATFGAPTKVSTFDGPFAPSLGYDASGTLWLSYGFATPTYRAAVDKSCDGGITWSGAVAVDAGATDVLFGSLAMTTGAAPVLFGAEPDNLVSLTLAPE
jgi:hypothetical protein